MLVLFQNSEISLFETNIRFMGSLLACYALTGDVMFRDKAAQLGERMLPAFQTETGIPHSLINLHTGVSAAFRCHNSLVLASTRRDGFDVLWYYIKFVSLLKKRTCSLTALRWKNKTKKSRIRNTVNLYRPYQNHMYILIGLKLSLI